MDVSSLRRRISMLGRMDVGRRAPPPPAVPPPPQPLREPRDTPPREPSDCEPRDPPRDVEPTERPSGSADTRSGACAPPPCRPCSYGASTHPFSNVHVLQHWSWTPKYWEYLRIPCPSERLSAMFSRQQWLVSQADKLISL